MFNSWLKGISNYTIPSMSLFHEFLIAQILLWFIPIIPRIPNRLEQPAKKREREKRELIWMSLVSCCCCLLFLSWIGWKEEEIESALLWFLLLLLNISCSCLLVGSSCLWLTLPSWILMSGVLIFGAHSALLRNILVAWSLKLKISFVPCSHE